MPPSLDTRDMRLAVVGAIVIQVGVALMSRRVLGPMEQIGPAELMLGFVVLPSLAAIIWIWFATVWREAHGWTGLGYAWTSRQWLLRAVALGVVSVPATMLITALTRPLLGPATGPALPLSPEQALGQPVYFLTMVLGIAVLSPLMEEIVFRGLLFGWLRRRFSLWNAAGLAAVAHGIMHFDLGAMPGLFALFLFLAWIYEYSESLWVPSIIHGIHNLVVLQMA